ncbi:HDOD domain-containing protein [Desulfonema magnum]|uniref:Probable chemoreceptor glutamine deamidase CheD n=1 Tax=Desulfonema magnum TaxID=45655 RepID=A0A975BKT6_9BACT|nr:HDOD domain-containing protein [Desulfonema magnum]QTA87231.1 Chemoreceptor glutamine deamidase CheD superfamily protein [Desulfonema magnum]
MALRSEFVPVGELRVSADKTLELITITGSCVAVVLYDEKHYLGGMLHVVLPGRRNSSRKSDRNAYFADTGVPMLIKEMIRYGARPEHLKAEVIGGGALVTDDSGLNIGRRNAEAVTDLLKKAGIPILRTSVGGQVSRRVTLDIATGQIKVESSGRHPESTQDLRSFENLGGLIKILGKKLEMLKPNPTWARNLMKAVHEPETNWKNVRGMISRCLILSMHVFRLANSSYYGSPGKISSCEQALAVLGSRQFRRICMLASLIRQSEPFTDNFHISEAMVSRHCLAAAVTARYLASGMPHQFREDAFSTGMLHGIGAFSFMLLNASCPNKFTESDIKWDKLGGLILSEWNLPEHIVTAVSSYKAPAPGTRGRPCLAAFTHLGCGISRLLGITASPRTGEFNFSSEAIKEIISDNDIASVLPGVLKELRLRGLLEYFNLDVKKT